MADHLSTPSCTKEYRYHSMLRSSLLCLLPLLLIASACGDGCGGRTSGTVESPDPLSDLRLSSGLPRGMARSPRGDVLVSVGGVFLPFGGMFALTPDATQARWVVELPDTPSAPVISSDNVIYLGTSSRVYAYDLDGKRLPYRSEVASQQISLGAHDAPLVWDARGGLYALDKQGAVFAQSEQTGRILGAGVDQDGYTYGVVSDTIRDEQGQMLGVYSLVKWSRNLSTVWQVPLWEGVHSEVIEFALGDEAIYISSASQGTMAHARADGAPVWQAPQLHGPLVVGPNERVHVGPHILDANGEVSATLDAQHIDVMTLEEGGAIWAKGRIEGILETDSDPVHMHFDAEGTRDASTLTYEEPGGAPVLVEHTAAMSSGRVLVLNTYPESGGINTTAGSDAFTQSISPAGAIARGPWPRSGGGDDHNSARHPQRARQPISDELYGTWVWRDEREVRAIEFLRQALRFDMTLEGDHLYGVYDYTLPHEARLVQAGTWSVSEDGEEVILTIVEDVAPGNKGKQLHRKLSESLPGVLKLEDPLAPRSLRTYSRRARLPGPEELVTPSFSPLWLYSSDRYDMISGGDILGLADGSARVVAYFVDYLLQEWSTELTNRDAGFVIATFDQNGSLASYKETTLPAPLLPRFDDDASPATPTLYAFDYAAAFARLTEQGQSFAHQPYEPLSSSNVIRQWIKLMDGSLLLAGYTSPDPLGGRLIPTLWWYSPEGKLLQTRQLEIDDTLENNTITGLAQAPTGEIILVGVVRGALTLGETRIEALTYQEPRVLADIESTRVMPKTFVARLAPESGDVLDARAFPGAMDARVAVDSSGDIILVGSTSRINLGAGELYPQAEDPTYAESLVLAKLDPNLDLLWFSPFNVDIYNRVEHLHVDAWGNITLGGRLTSHTTRGVPFASPGDVTTILQLERCGRPVNAISARGSWGISGMDLDEQGRIWGSGSFVDDVELPDRTLIFEGLLPDLSTGDPGTSNPVVFSYQGVSDEFAKPDGSPHDCAPQSFEGHTIHVSLRGGGEGRIISEPAGIDCPGTCSAEFPQLSEVRLIIQPGEETMYAGLDTLRGAHFEQDCIGVKSECTLQASTDVTVEGWFYPDPPTQLVQVPEGLYNYSFVVDARGHVTMLGQVSAPLQFAGKMLAPQQSALVQWDAAGQQAWALELGEFAGSLNLINGSSDYIISGRAPIASLAPTVLHQDQDYGLGLLRVGPDGTPIWGAKMPGDSSAGRFLMDADEERGVVLSHWVYQPTTLEEVSIGAREYYVAHITADGDLGWVHPTTLTQQEHSLDGLLFAAQDKIQLHGLFTNTLTVEGTQRAQTFEPAYFTATYAASGGGLLDVEAPFTSTQNDRRGYFDRVIHSEQGIYGYFGPEGIARFIAPGEYQLIPMTIDGVSFAPSVGSRHAVLTSDDAILISHDPGSPLARIASPSHTNIVSAGIVLDDQGALIKRLLWTAEDAQEPQAGSHVVAGEDGAFYWLKADSNQTIWKYKGTSP